ncbi:MAG TPA: hypothetical protein VFV75_03755 [Candidatus Polarisedimenticolaceae bacterium]|nr:hypothetical protein [Candidatus Polarisedimenticolaceae bacterium]
MSKTEFEGDGDDMSRSVEHLIPGKHYYADLISESSASGNTGFWVIVGSNNWASAQSNDMEVHMRSIQMWLIHSVGIRIAP